MTPDPGALLELQLRAERADHLEQENARLRLQARTARALMTEMEKQYNLAKSNERRLIETAWTLQKAINIVRHARFFFLLPREIKQWIRANAG